MSTDFREASMCPLHEGRQFLLDQQWANANHLSRLSAKWSLEAVATLSAELGCRAVVDAAHCREAVA